MSDGYTFDDETGKELSAALRAFSTTCDNLHAAWRMDVPWLVSG